MSTTIVSGPIFEPDPRYPSCHAATVVELADGRLLAAWFAGTHEGHPDVAIRLAHCDGDTWHEPSTVIDDPGVPLWNPVLFRDETDTVWLFFKAGPTVPAWTGLSVSPATVATRGLPRPSCRRGCWVRPRTSPSPSAMGTF